jgi:hypothetical protein
MRKNTIEKWNNKMEVNYMQELAKGDLIIYEDENNKIEIEAFLYNETL